MNPAISELLEQMTRHGTSIEAHGDSLRLKGPRNVLTPEVLALLGEHKLEIIGVLKREAQRPSGWAGIVLADGGPATGGEEPAHKNQTSAVSTIGGVSAEVGTGYQVLESASDMEAAIPRLMAAPATGVDLETTGLDPHLDRIRLVQLATPDCVYILDGFKVNPAALNPVLESQGLKVLHNAKFDLQFLLAQGVTVNNVYDTMLADQVLRGSHIPRKLAVIAKEHMGVELDKSHQASDWARDLTPQQLSYAARDAAVLLPLHACLDGLIQENALEVCMAIENRAVPAVAWMEYSGVAFDREAWKDRANVADQRRRDVLSELNSLAGVALREHGLEPGAINWQSHQQVRAFLQRLGLHLSSTKEAELATVRERHPAVAKLLEYRGIEKLASTYGSKFLGHVHPSTGRIHPDWRQIGADTGRMSCTRPNAQNVPRERDYRRCFLAPEGRVLIKADYSQIELRIAAEVTKDARMLRAYKDDGGDLHTITARQVLGKEQVSKADRQQAKPANFGLLYGMGAPRLREYALSNYGVHMTEEEAGLLRGRFFAAYPGLRQWHRSQTYGDRPISTRTLSGRRRIGVKSFTEKLNSPIQGTGADGLKAALALMWDTRGCCPSAAPVLAIHDEIVVECAHEDSESVKTWVVDCMKRGMGQFLHEVPVEVEAAIQKCWAE